MIRPPRIPSPHAVWTFSLLLAGCGVQPAEAPLTDEALLGTNGTLANSAHEASAKRAAASPSIGGSDAARARLASPCVDSVQVAAGWAGRMPPAFPLYPGATLVEAGGTDAPCGLRVLSFRSARPPAALLNWYEVRARNAGYTAERDGEGAERRLGGTRGDDAFALFVQPDGEGSAAQLLANAGR